MRILIMGEYSGRVRDAFTNRGHTVVSCDIEHPTLTPGFHYRGDVLDILYNGWDMMIAHPTCTFLTVSGLHWNKNNPDREREKQKNLLNSVNFFGMRLLIKLQLKIQLVVYPHVLNLVNLHSIFNLMIMVKMLVRKPVYGLKDYLNCNQLDIFHHALQQMVKSGGVIKQIAVKIA